MTTVHIAAQAGDFAETVLMPGDPLRAKYIAETFLSDVSHVNEVRNMLGFTGFYKGQRVSVMGSGMGIPSISIYAYELFTHFSVKNIIRVGSCGAIQPHVQLRDVVIAMGATTDSMVNRNRLKGRDFAATASFDLLVLSAQIAKKNNVKFHVGNVFSADLFYDADDEVLKLMAKYGVLATEMEAAGLYGVAAQCGGNALTIATVSDHILTGEKVSAQDRQSSFNDMVQIALETSCTQSQ